MTFLKLKVRKYCFAASPNNFKSSNQQWLLFLYNLFIWCEYYCFPPFINVCLHLEKKSHGNFLYWMNKIIAQWFQLKYSFIFEMNASSFKPCLKIWAPFWSVIHSVQSDDCKLFEPNQRDLISKIHLPFFWIKQRVLYDWRW